MRKLKDTYVKNFIIAMVILILTIGIYYNTALLYGSYNIFNVTYFSTMGYGVDPEVAFLRQEVFFRSIIVMASVVVFIYYFIRTCIGFILKIKEEKKAAN